MGMHEFHITTYVLTCDECGTTFGNGTERYAGDLIQQAKNNDWQVIMKSPTDNYYCPEHWQYSCRDCGKVFHRPSPHTKGGNSGTTPTPTYARTAPKRGICPSSRNWRRNWRSS